ncbi:response regulator [Marivirga arenosa]|uniref:histidine kinase n=1 Tax=Marivirga arenosa TaxID=3059076 RepID=A0AA52F049_9BACT|nr:response regulator [Marivirga sp. BKB1-2]WNB18697.1 response regulator [Marivirga sp. BKB1-2]
MRKSILIVEDSTIVSMHLKQVLLKANYEVLNILTSGEDAIKFIKDHDPSLVIMDVMIEGKYDGIETSIEINKIKDVPVIYLTALNDKKTIDRAKLTFPTTFLSKPFAESELLSNVELSLYKHEADLQKKESQKLLSTILGNIKSCLIVIDSNFNIKYANEFMTQLLGIEHDEILKLKIGNDLKVLDQDEEPLSITKLNDQLKNELINQDILFLIFNDKKLPINNITLTNAKFYNEETEQFLVVFNDARESYEKLLKEKAEKSLKLAAQIEGAEKERVRVSRELHDGLGQMLNVIKMNIKTLIDKADVKSKLIELINASIEESHKISENLMPSKLQIFDLKTSLENLCEDYNSPSLNVQFSNNLNEGDLDDKKINLFRIVQEALNNIYKHAQAKNVSIQLYLREKGIHLTIEDDGIGFDANQINSKDNLNKSHGLLNMIDRVKSMGGEIDIDSNAKFGTNIIIHI